MVNGPPKRWCIPFEEAKKRAAREILRRHGWTLKKGQCGVVGQSESQPRGIPVESPPGSLDKCLGDLGLVVRLSSFLSRCSSGLAGSIPVHLSSFDSEPARLLWDLQWFVMVR